MSFNSEVMRTVIYYYYYETVTGKGKRPVKSVYHIFGNIATVTNLLKNRSVITFNNVSIPSIAEKITYERYERLLIDNNCIHD